jgi:hypothetical protein
MSLNKPMTNSMMSKKQLNAINTPFTLLPPGEEPITDAQLHTRGSGYASVKQLNFLENNYQMNPKRINQISGHVQAGTIMTNKMINCKEPYTNQVSNPSVLRRPPQNSALAYRPFKGQFAFEMPPPTNTDSRFNGINGSSMSV